MENIHENCQNSNKVSRYFTYYLKAKGQFVRITFTELYFIPTKKTGLFLNYSQIVVLLLQQSWLSEKQETFQQLLNIYDFMYFTHCSQPS